MAVVKQLHITNGDGAVDQIKACDPSGNVLPWRDPMHHGPFPAINSLDRLSQIRSYYLNGKDFNPLIERFNQGVSDNSELQHDFTERDEQLKRAHEYEEVVLWFEHDLLDQLQIVQILSWFERCENMDCSLSLICIDRFASVENFRGIGQLDQAQMASLYPQRVPVTDSQLSLASRIWEAFRQPNPNDLHTLCYASTASFNELPFLKNALLRYFQEFPWISDGLSRTERQLLSLVHAGISSPVQLFINNMNYEDALYIGDWRTYAHLHELCTNVPALLACDSGKAFMYPWSPDMDLEEFRAQRLTITPFAQEVLAGRATVIDSLMRDHWLGGVHLNAAQPFWCWDNDNSRLIVSTG